MRRELTGQLRPTPETGADPSHRAVLLQVRHVSRKVAGTGLEDPAEMRMPEAQ